jgi:hypothetical protein
VNDFEALTIAVISPLQDIEDAFQQLLTQRGLSTSIGAQLDQLGDLVGQTRQGLDDDDYRRYIAARILTNRSCGELNRLNKISRLVVDIDAASFVVHFENYATEIMRIADVAVTFNVADILIGFLRQAKAAGVRLVLQFSESVPGNTFRLDGGPGLDVGHLAGALE